MMTQTDILKLNMFDTASDKFSNDALNENWQKIDDGLALTGSAEGPNIQITDAANNCGLYSLVVEGKSSQNGTPTPDAPIEINSIGDSGSFAVTTDNGGEISTTATITTALPLCSVDDVKDELIFNADGTAKVIKRFEKLILDGSETWGTQTTNTSGAYRLYSPLRQPASVINNGITVKGACTHFAVISADNVYRGNEGISTTTTNQVSLYFAEYNSSDSATTFKTWLTENPVTFIYELATPEEINLTADETAAMLSLETFEGLTNVFNSDNAQMSVKYWRNEALGSLLTSISRSTNSRLTALENAIIGG